MDVALELEVLDELLVVACQLIATGALLFEALALLLALDAPELITTY